MVVSGSPDHRKLVSMTHENYVYEVREAMQLLQSGGRLFVIDEQAYPPPHPVVISLGNRRYPISADVFSILIGLDRNRFTGSTSVDGLSADEFYLIIEAGQAK